jgi:hypothetical protein
MGSPVDLGTALLGAVKELTTAVREWVAGAPTRKMKRAIEYGERYIRLASPILKDKMTSKEDKKILHELKDIEESFFKNN